MSSGLADAGDPRVQNQLRANRLRRKEEMPSRLADVGQFPRVAMDTEPTLRNLRSHAGTGVSDYRKEYLRAFVTDFADMRARTVLPLLNAFASAYANADLPAWFYTVFTAVKAALPIKSPAPAPDAAMDVRPVGVGECLRRAIHSALVAQHNDLLRQHLRPQQVAIGVPSGMNVLVFGMRLTLEIRPDFAVVRVGLENAHNEVKRAPMVRRTAAAEHLGGLAPPLWATYCPKSDIHLPIDGALEKADFASEERAQQGDGLASAGFCVTIHPEVCQLDAELGPHGGAARFDMDDGYAMGPPHVVFPAVMRFAQSLLPLGLELQVTRCECSCPNGGLENHPDRPAHIPLGGMEASDGIFGFGVPVGGVPVGDSVYIIAYMDKEAQATMSTINNVNDKPCDLHLQSLYSVTLHSLAPKILYHVQHVFPEDGRQANAKVDAAIRQAVAPYVGDTVVEDDIARARLLLPARMYRGGIKSLEDVAPAAFISALGRAVPEFLDRRREDFSVQPGFLPMLAPVLSHGSFDEGYPAPFQGLLATGTLTAAALQRHWAELQQEVGAEGRGAGAGALAGPLNMNVEAASVGVAKAQRAITRQCEQKKLKSLDARVHALPPADMRRAAWLNVDRNSTVWVTAWPTRNGYLSNPEFAEVATRYFGVPSPACGPLVGQRIANTRHMLDRHGASLTTAPLPADGVKWRIFEDAKEMGARCLVEVYGLFAACMPQDGRALAADMPSRKRQGLVPDFLFNLPLDGPERKILFELKALHYGSTTYPASRERCEAVACRARTLHREYADTARTLDRKCCRTPAGSTGPVENKVRSYDPMRGSVFGAWGEGSTEVDRLIGMRAHIGSRRHWRSMQVRSADEAQGALSWMLRRRWAVTAFRKKRTLEIRAPRIRRQRGSSSSSPKAERGHGQRSTRQEGGVRVPPRSACGLAPLGAHAHMMRILNALTGP